MTTTHSTLSTRRDTIAAILGLTLLTLVSVAVLALLLSFLTGAAPGLFHSATTAGQGVASPGAVAASGFPYRHLTVRADTGLPGRATVTLDDGTGQPGAEVTRSLPFDGSPYPTDPDPASACDTDGVCWGSWTISPALDVTISTTYQGAVCVITGNPASRPRITCDGYTVPS